MVYCEAMYRALDIFFFVFHTGLILFILFGWTLRRVRRIHLIVVLLTLFSWFVLGIWYGFGYCPCTDWHWQVRIELGQTDLPFSYITFLIESLTGRAVNETWVNAITVITFFAVCLVTAWVNVAEWRAKKKGSCSCT